MRAGVYHGWAAGVHEQAYDGEVIDAVVAGIPGSTTIRASVHANAGTYENTNWDLILGMYNTLLSRGNNPMVAINRAVVLGEVEGYTKAISELETLKGFGENCYYNTSLAEMC